MSDTNMPDEIWMQLVYDENHVPSLDTWSKDNIHIDDIKYIRADLVPTQSEDECETCKGDPETCASVPNIRHCEKAQRTREVEDKDRVMDMTRKPEHDQVSGLQFDGRISYKTITTWDTSPIDPPERGVFIPRDNDDALKALDDLVFLWSELSLSKGIETIRNRLEQCAEYEKRIEELEEIKYWMFNGLETTIKHMRGE